ncbi:MAG: ABC transporter permease [Puniceicoccaceae bacterium]|nr:MAG: ABC transporter permease [Puniceicoccaceae bacterium]
MKHLLHLLRSPFSCLLSHRDLLTQLTVRNLDARHRGSWLGRLWLVFQPLLLLAVYTFVFSVIFDGGYGVVEDETAAQYALGIFLGILVLGLFNDSLGFSVTAVTGNPNFVKKVVFPLEVLPPAIVLMNLYTFGISFLLALVGVWVFGGGVPLTALWVPVLLLPMVFLGAGVAWGVAALGVFYRDLSPVIQVVTLCMLWLSAVFYSARAIPEAAWQIVRFNPVLLTIESVRDVVLWKQHPEPVWVLYCFGISALLFYSGFFIFRKLRDTFADVL